MMSRGRGPEVEKIKKDFQKVFKINDADVWKLLLLKNPEGKVSIYGVDGKPSSAFQQYNHIAESLDLVQRAERNKLYEKKRQGKVKYKLLVNNHNGMGFLFTARPLSHV